MFSIRKPTEPFTLVFKQIQLDYEGATYRGPGVGRWDPDKGLKIDGFMKIYAGDAPTKVDFGKPGIIDPNLTGTIRLITDANERGVIFVRPIRDQLSLIHSGHFDVSTDTVTLIQKDEHLYEDRWGITLTYEGNPTDALFVLPDKFRQSSYIGTDLVNEFWTGSLKYEEADIKVRIAPGSGNQYHIEWSLGCSRFPTGSIRQLAEGIILAWQFYFDSPIVPIGIELARRGRSIHVYQERRSAEKLWPYTIKTKAVSKFTGKDFVRLGLFLAQPDTESHVARKMIRHCIEASAGRWSIETKALLRGAIFEAALRTLENKPFVTVRKTDKFNASQALAQFRSRYLGAKWRRACALALQAFRRLRHRSAHPDWVFGHGGSLSEKKVRESVNDMIYLSRFYGYMILAMAGWNDLEPEFPKPIDEWESAITFSSGTNSQNRQ